MPNNLLNVKDHRNPDEVVAELKKQGIASLDDLVKKSIELHQQKPVEAVVVFYHQGFVYYQQ
jgi:hypothetical protein